MSVMLWKKRTWLLLAILCVCIAVISYLADVDGIGGLNLGLGVVFFSSWLRKRKKRGFAGESWKWRAMETDNRTRMNKRLWRAPMHERWGFALCALLVLGPALATDKALEGAWELQGGEYVAEDGQTKTYAEMRFNGQKVLADGRFSFTMQSGDKFWAGGAGRYEAEGGRYTETLAQRSFAVEDGGTYSFRYRVEGDVWRLERWKDGKRVEFEEWKKVRP